MSIIISKGMKIIMWSIACIFLISCHTKNNGEVSAKPDTTIAISSMDTDLNSRIIDTPVIHVLQADSGTVLQFPDKDSNQVINSFFSKNIHVYVKLPVIKNDRVKGTISPAPADCNIRFNQVIEADGSMNGPFARQIEYTAKSTGILTIIIGRSLMAEGADSCRFLLSIKKN